MGKCATNKSLCQNLGSESLYSQSDELLSVDHSFVLLFANP